MNRNTSHYLNCFASVRPSVSFGQRNPSASQITESFNDHVGHVFQLAGIVVIEGQVSEPVLEGFVRDGAGGLERGGVVAQLLHDAEFVERRKMRERHQTAFRQLLLKHLDISAGPVGINLEQIQVMTADNLLAVERGRNQSGDTGQPSIEVVGGLAAFGDDAVYARHLLG